MTDLYTTPAATAAPAAPAVPATTPNLRLLPGRPDADAELAELIQDVREHNTRRVRRASTRRLHVKPATGETRHIVVRDAEAPASTATITDCSADRQALASFVRAVRRLQSASGREQTQRLLAANATATADATASTSTSTSTSTNVELRAALAAESDALGRRLAQHCRNGCSVTGVRVTDASIRNDATGSIRPCPAVRATDGRATAPADESWAGGDFAGAFALPADELASRSTLHLNLHNVLGRERPFVPVFVQLEVTVGLGRGERRLRTPGGIFVYAEDLAPGDTCDLRIGTAGLLDRLPCPPSLIREARLLVWLPRPSGEQPLPQPMQGSCRLVAA